jgi:hypothetical protein
MDFNEMSMKYVVRIDEKGHHFSLYSNEAIKTFNNIVFPNRGSNVEVVDCLITKKDFAEDLIKKLDNM